MVFRSLLVTILAGCGGSSPPRASVVLISIDTLRADHLGCYGYGRDTSPAIDQLAAGGVVFERAFAHAPSTLPSHASLLTSLLPQHHGASHADRRPLPPLAATLTEVLAAHEYRTVSFNGGGQIAAEFGLAQGFEVYESVARDDDRFSVIARQALRWLDSEPSQPAFLFLHSYEVHQPFTADRRFYRDLWPGRGLSSQPSKIVRALRERQLKLDDEVLAEFRHHYDAEIRSMDDGLGQLMEGLRRRRIYDNALIVLTSDHGEEFGEHGEAAVHAHTLYKELLHVPLILKLPGGRYGGLRIETPVRSIDVAPTMLAALGLERPQSFAGQDLLALLSKPSTDRSELPAIAYRDTAIDEPVSSLRLGRWKLIGQRLYDLDSDPRELTDAAASNPEMVRSLATKLRHELQQRQALESGSIELRSETLDELEALGYVD